MNITLASSGKDKVLRRVGQTDQHDGGEGPETGPAGQFAEAPSPRRLETSARPGRLIPTAAARTRSRRGIRSRNCIVRFEHSVYYVPESGFTNHRIEELA